MTIPEPKPGPRGGVESPSDEEILDLVADGRHHAFDLIVARYGARVRRYLRQVAGSFAPLDDLTQDVFVKAFREAGNRSGKGTFAAWLYRVARHRAVDHVRREQARRRAMGHVQDAEMRRPAAPSPSANLEAAEFQHRLEDALAQLNEEFRTAFLLREQEGMSYEEIAEVLEISPKTVSTRIHRARTRLRRLLQPWLTDGPGGGENDS